MSVRELKESYKAVVEAAPTSRPTRGLDIVNQFSRRTALPTLVREGLKLLTESEDRRSCEAEKNAFYQIGNILEGTVPGQVTAIEIPKCSDGGFPDFAFRVKAPSGKKIDIHFEYKMNKTDQMGGLRTWKFDGRKFSTTRTDDEADFIIKAMNQNSQIVRGGQTMMDSYKQAADELGVGPINFIGVGGVTSIIPSREKNLRKRFVKRVLEINGTQMLGTIKGGFGLTIINNYREKFKKNLQSGSDCSICLFMVGNKIWYLDSHNADEEDVAEVASMLDVDEIDMRNLNPNSIDGNLEVRLQMNISSNPFKQPKVDTFAAMRMLGNTLRGGTKVY